MGVVEGYDINLFREAREDAGMDVEDAVKVLGDPYCNTISIRNVEAMRKTQFKMPAWGPKYLSALREIAYENTRMWM